MKMVTELEVPVRYHLPVGKELVYLNGLIGKRIEIHYLREFAVKSANICENFTNFIDYYQ